MGDRMSHHGLFVGLVTLDLIYLIQHFPNRNQKIVAIDHTTAAGGPATNAAVAFRHLGGTATLMGAIGVHPLSQWALMDLQQRGVAIVDLTPDGSDPLSTSSILVTQATAERAVVSLNATHSQVSTFASADWSLQEVQIVLIDGHQMKVGQTIASQAKARGIPVAIDAGSWKPGFEKVLPYVDYAICSSNFYPPGCRTQADVFAYLSAAQIPQIAITGGEKPIQYKSQGQMGELEVPQIQAVDTLGAGDIFHGAFCHAILQMDFLEALTQAAQVAAFSCQFFGTRRWMEQR